jgi:hypothetical protein
MDEGRQWIQMSAPISPGSSGGPVLNPQGQVIGISTMYRTDGQNLNFAVPIKYAMGLALQGGQGKPLAATFARDDAQATSTWWSSGSNTDRASAVAPPPTDHPRGDVRGSWKIVEQIVITQGDSTSDYAFPSYLFLGPDDVGFLISMDATSSMPDGSPFYVQAINATPDGRVSLTLDNIAMDGYQTATGLYLEGVVATDGDATVTMRLFAVPGSLPLSRATGLYALEGSTDAHILEPPGVLTVTWQGTSAIVVSKDSIFVDLAMVNRQGGNALATAAGPLVNGHFDIQSRGTDVHLVGSVGAGRVAFKYTDFRKWGYYVGSIEGRRR